MAIDSIDDVRLFRQIVSAGGISAAARVVQRNKNLVSKRLASLETALGMRLAERTTRSFRLTEEGERFWQASEALVEAADRTEEAITMPGGVDGRVRVAVRSALAGMGLGAEFVRLLHRAPRLQLQIAVIDDNADIRERGFDLAVQAGQLADSSLVVKRLGRADYAMAATHAYLRAAGTPRSPSDLVRHECIRRLGDTRETSWALVGTAGRRTTAKLGGRFECSDARLQGEMIYAGFGIGLLPLAEVRRGQHTGALERVLPGWQFAPVPVWAVSPRGRMALERVARVYDVLVRAVAALS
jgi:DNA-binding transcriptional LysR family regulator